MVLDVLLWPVVLCVQLVSSVALIIINLVLWLVLTFIPQLLAILAGIAYGLLELFTVLAPVAMEVVSASVSLAASGLVSASELVFTLAYSAGEVLWIVMAEVFIFLWMVCGWCLSLLLSTAQWLVQAAYLSAQAAGTVMEYIWTLPWAVWGGETLGFVGTSFRVLSSWIDYLGTSLSSFGSDNANVVVTDRAPGKGMHQPFGSSRYKEPGRFTVYESSMSPWDQFAEILPSWQQGVGLIAVFILLIVLLHSVRRLLRNRETQRVQPEPNQGAEEQPVHETRQLHRQRRSVPVTPAFRLSQRRRDSPEPMGEQNHPSPTSARNSPVGREATDGSQLHRRLNELSADLEREREGNLCAVCLDRSREVLLRPCNHYCVCSECLRNLGGKCPMCRQRIRGSERVFRT